MPWIRGLDKPRRKAHHGMFLANKPRTIRHSHVRRSETDRLYSQHVRLQAGHLVLRHHAAAGLARGVSSRGGRYGQSVPPREDRRGGRGRARGFIFAAPVAMELNASLVPIRKPGKLPFPTESLTYDLEYGTDTLQIHADAVTPGAKVLIVDDLLATGGTVGGVLQTRREGGRRHRRLFFFDRVGRTERRGAHRPV